MRAANARELLPQAQRGILFGARGRGGPSLFLHRPAPQVRRHVVDRRVDHALYSSRLSIVRGGKRTLPADRERGRNRARTPLPKPRPAMLEAVDPATGVLIRR